MTDCGRPRYGAVVFDLDGTLVDSRPGIEAAVDAAVAAVAPARRAPSLAGLLGLPLDDLMRAVAPDLEESRRADLAAAFRDHYDTTGWRSSPVYEHVLDTLAELRRRGVRLFVVTNKRRRPTLAILGAAGIEPELEAVYTPDSRVPAYEDKGTMALACLAEARLGESEVIVVGDSADDLDMADRCAAAFAAAAWGYGDAAARVVARSWQEDHQREAGPPRTVIGSMAGLLALVVPERPGEAGHES